MAFCLEAEKFVDERLSNWYVRRNRERFWSKNAELDAAGLRDKLAAYQTLYSVLTTLCKLIAPAVPFLAETMWRNLRTPTDPESVHLCDYPIPENTLVDDELLQDVQALLRIVSLGGAARNAARAKVRQPLAELRIQTENKSEQRAVFRFRHQIADELNVKNVALHYVTQYIQSALGINPYPQIAHEVLTQQILRLNGLDPANLLAGELLSHSLKRSLGVEPNNLLIHSVKLNKKTAGTKLGPDLKRAEDELARINAEEVVAKLRTGPVSLAGVELDASDFVIEPQAESGWAGVEDKSTQVALDTRITDELKLEGLARDVIRQVQDGRKTANLDLADKIALHLATNGDLARAIAAHRDAIATATQAVEWSDAPLNGAAHTTTVKVEGHDLTISLRKV
jgi:isoleucyl-tRNA synthetase